jgi:hypothetical protein
MFKANAAGALVAVIVSVLSGCAVENATDEGDIEAVAQELGTDITVYADTALGSPWQNWGWSTNVAFANTETPRLTGSSSQIKMTTTGAWGALALVRTSGNLLAADYDSISFDVRGPASSSLYFFLETLAGNGGTQVVVPVTTTWTKRTIKIDALKGGLTSFAKLDWMGPSSGQSFYIDNVKLIAKTAPPPPPPPPSSFPTNPLTVTYNDVVTLNSGSSPYYLYVPTAYNGTHVTPSKLLVWMHGCGGTGYGDAWSASPGGTQSWITVSVGGRDGDCWNVDTDTSLVLAALTDIKKRVNVDPRRVVIGGYSSGGDMAYRTAFYNATKFAGVIAENTSPFRDTGSSQSASIAAAAWKLNIAHLAHLSDDVYPIAGVRAETEALKTAGFPLTRIERAGTHWDPDTSNSGTDYDLRTYLLPYINAGWLAP